jgi:hypothetical protein
MATNNCGTPNCGCTNSYTVTAPCPPSCPEVFNAQCIVYTGTDIMCNQDVVIRRYDYLDTIITKLVNYLCNVEAPVSVVVGSTYIDVVPNVVGNVTTYTVYVDVPALQAYFEIIFGQQLAASILAGPGIDVAVNPVTNTVTVIHEDSGNTFIQDIAFTFDTFGHVTGASVVPATVTPPNDFGKATVNPDSGFVWGPNNDPTNIQIAEAPGDTLNFVAGTGITLNASTVASTDAIRITNSDPGSAVTLASAGGTETLVNDGVGPALITKGLTAGAGISLTGTGTDITIANTAIPVTTTLGSAGGTESLVNDGVGPALATKGLTAGVNSIGEGITLTGTVNDVTVGTTFNKWIQSSAVLTGATVTVTHNLSTTALFVSVLEYDGGLPTVNAYVHGTDYEYRVTGTNVIEITNTSGVNWAPAQITVFG